MQVSFVLRVLCVCLLIGNVSGTRHNTTCTSNLECDRIDTYLRCTKHRCLCAADADFDYRHELCRLKINVQCYLKGKNIQPCVKGAICDPPSYIDGGKISGASTGNCKCNRGVSNDEDGTCYIPIFQRSVGHSKKINSTLIIVVSLSLVVLLLFCNIG